MATQWLLVAHNAGARVFSRENFGPWVLAHRIDHDEGRAHTADLVSDRAGRGQKGMNGPHIAMDPSTSPKEAELDRFAHRLVQLLETGEFDSLVMTAPPRLLGKLRQGYSGKRLIASFDRDYAHMDDLRAVAAVQELQGL